MDKIQTKEIIYSPNLIQNKLYYKKMVYRKKHFINSLSPINSKDNFTQVMNLPERKNIAIYSNLHTNHSKNKKKNIFPTTSPSKKRYQNKYLYQKNNSYYNNIKSIILIQKYIKGFLLRNKIRKNMKKIIIENENKQIFGRSGIDPILNGIKRNSYNQKNNVKALNNMLNNNCRITMNNKNAINNLFKKNLILLKKNKNCYSYVHLPKTENENEGNKTYRKINANSNINKSNDIINNRYNDNHETFSPEETNFNTKQKSVYSKPSKDLDNNIDTNNFQKKIENNCSFLLTEFSLSCEQCPQNLNKINSVDIIENKDEEEKNLNINNELYQNENKNVISLRILNPLSNNKNICNLISNENKKKLILPKLTPNNISRSQIKENTSDNNLKNDIFITYDNSKDKDRNSHRSAKEIIFKDKNIYYSNLNNIYKIKEKKSKNKKQTKEKKRNKKNKKHKNSYDNKNKNNKKNFDSYKELNNCIKVLVNEINSDKNLFKNNLIYNSHKNLINNSNKENKIFESIKEEKLKESDTNDIKSSFYENEDFDIISYDYSLNDKNKLLKIFKAENFNIKGGLNKINNFIIALKNVIRKNLYKYIFKLLKKIKIYDEDDISITINDSCSFINPNRIKKNKIIFEYAKIDIKNKNKDISRNKNKIQKKE